MEEAYAEAYHPRSNHVVKICAIKGRAVCDGPYEVTLGDFSW